MRRLTRLRGRPTVALVLAVTAMATALSLFAELNRMNDEYAEDRLYQLHEVQESLSNLHRDLRMVGVIATTAREAKGPATEAYLSARREELAPVRWLADAAARGNAVDTLLTSADTHGFDPSRDTAVRSMLDGLPASGLRAGEPSTYRGTTSLALVLPTRDGDKSAIVALVDMDMLLADSMHNLKRPPLPFVLRLGDHEVARWPVHAGHHRYHGNGTTALPASMGTLDFTLAFANPTWPQVLGQLSALPLMLLVTGICLAAAVALGTRPAAVPPITGGGRLDMRTMLWRLGGLASSLAHDLGQPLNVIRLTAEAALDALDHGGDDPARLRRGLTTAVDQVRRAQTMLDALVASSRRPDSPPRLFDPAAVLEQALERVEQRVSVQGVELLRRIERPVTPVMGHADRLAAALAHLLVNACKAVAASRLEGGAGATIEAGCRRDGTIITLWVADNGPGMPAPLRAQLADPASVPTGRDSLGLGLTVAIGVAAELGGVMEVEELAPGTRVSLRLPTAGRSVLVVDDDEAALAELTRSLEGRGWRVLGAHGGNAALRLFTEAPADVVVTDLEMPDGDGWQLIARLRARAPDLPILAMSGLEGERARAAVTAGATAILRKPLVAAEVADELDAITITD